MNTERNNPWPWRQLSGREGNPTAEPTVRRLSPKIIPGLPRLQQLELLRDGEPITSRSFTPSQITKPFGILEGDHSRIYGPLNITTREFRFLELLPLSENISGSTVHIEKGVSNTSRSLITCRLVIRPMNDCPSFEALSYRWDKKPPNPEYIILEGQQIEIRHNLAKSLKRTLVGECRASLVG